MRINFFTDAESFAEYNMGLAEAIRKNGLRQAKEAYEEELTNPDARTMHLMVNGMFRDEYTDADRDRVWERQLEWRRKQIKSLERKVAKLEREARQALAQA